MWALRLSRRSQFSRTVSRRSLWSLNVTEDIGPRQEVATPLVKPLQTPRLGLDTTDRSATFCEVQLAPAGIPLDGAEPTGKPDPPGRTRSRTSVVDWATGGRGGCISDARVQVTADQSRAATWATWPLRRRNRTRCLRVSPFQALVRRAPQLSTGNAATRSRYESAGPSKGPCSPWSPIETLPLSSA